MQFLFKKKNIIDLSLGEILQEQRKEKKVSLETAARATEINIKHLQALENGEYDKLPKGIYGKNFLREYCYYLGLNYKKLLLVYEGEQDLTNISEEEQQVFSRQRPKRHYFLPLPKLFRNTILVIVIILGFTYLGLRVKKIIAPPELLISWPPEGYISSENKIAIVGQTEDEVRIFVNGKEVLSDETGGFQETVNLKEGINVINIRAKKRYGRDAEVIRQVLVK